MYNHDFHHTRAIRMKRLAAWVCVAFSLLLVIGAFTYALQAGIIPGLSEAHVTLPLVSGLTGSSCSPHEYKLGDSNVAITSNKQKRAFLIHLPPTYGQEPLPVLFNYHGYDSSAAYMAKYTNLGAEADKEHFIAVFPQGALDSANPPKTSWNAGVGAFGPTGNGDDVQFARDMLSYLQHNYCIDSHRIYMTGYSIGASMAYRVACALTKQIAGLATVEGAFYHFDGGCQATRALPVLDIHSLADLNAPYNGSPTMHFFSVPTFLNLWLAVDQCSSSNQVIFQKADVTGYKWAKCSNGMAVEEYKITDGGHVWAGSAINRPDLGYTTHTIDANVVIWNFLSQFKS